MRCPECGDDNLRREGECPWCDRVFCCPDCDYESDGWRGYAIHYGRSHDGNAFLSLVGEHRLAALYRDHSPNEIADTYDLSRPTIRRALEAANIDKRDESEAAKMQWEQMGEQERKQQVKEAHHASRDSPRIKERPDGYEVIAHCGHYVYLHRLIAVSRYGFDAVCGSVVHHENGIPWDNRPENLEIMSQSEHMTEAHEVVRDEETGLIIGVRDA